MSTSVKEDDNGASTADGNYHCDSCDREARNVIRQLAPGGGVRYVCWSCLGREEKRFNVRDGWRRDTRARSGREG